MPDCSSTDGLAKNAIIRELEKILQSQSFIRSKQLSKFLHYVVTETLAGRADNISGFTVAMDVLGRSDSFDPAINPIVRSEARRLRQKLDEYYGTDGQDDPILISLDKGSYVPKFTRRGSAGPDELIGQTFSSFLILEKIGEGGMGTVFKAEDTRLHRKVALKVTPRSPGPSESRVRVSQDALAANFDHPNICTLYEAGETEDYSYIASAYIAGGSLEQRLQAGRIELPEALEIAMEIAQGLAAAHSHGVIHCDLNPSNVLLSDSAPEKAQVKIIDFGLSRSRPITGPVESSEPYGTLAYLSPEQAQGRNVDARTDIWSLGVMLYQTVSGRLPFVGENATMTRLAILKSAPAPLGAPELLVPAKLQGIVSKCLEKEAQIRYQSAEDLLAELSALADELRPRGESRDANRKRSVAVATVFSVLAVIAGVLLLSNYVVESPGDQAVRLDQQEMLTAFPGQEIEPTFSPDGNMVAFARRQEGENQFDIWTQVMGEENPLRITSSPVDDRSPSWSPDGRYIAFVRHHSLEEHDLILAPALGGSERVLAKLRHIATRPAWSPDGETIAIAEGDFVGQGAITLVSTRTDLKERISDRRRLASPVFSSDGNRIAFVASDTLYVVGIDGTGERVLVKGPLARDYSKFGTITSCPNGRSILYVKEGYFWTVPFTGGEPTPLGSAPAEIAHLTVSPSTGHVAYSSGGQRADVWLVSLTNGVKSPPRRVLASSRIETSARFSPNGEELVFFSNRSGEDGVWRAKIDGAGWTRLRLPAEFKLLGSPTWSGDGSMIAFDALINANLDVFVVDSSGGTPRRITNSSSIDGGPHLSSDGRWIYFTSDRSGWRQIWKVPAEGEVAVPKSAVQLTNGGGFFPRPSADGKYVYYAKPGEAADVWSIWRIPAEGGHEEPIVNPMYARPYHWSLAGEGLYLINHPDGKGSDEGWSIYRVDPTDRSQSILVELPIAPTRREYCFHVSPDERWAVFATDEPGDSDLVLFRNAFPVDH